MTERLTKLPISESLLSDSQKLAEELNISWSQLISAALSDFIRRQRKRKRFIDSINDAYAEAPSEAEETLQQKMRASHRRIVEGEW